MNERPTTDRERMTHALALLAARLTHENVEALQFIVNKTQNDCTTDGTIDPRSWKNARNAAQSARLALELLDKAMANMPLRRRRRRRSQANERAVKS